MAVKLSTHCETVTLLLEDDNFLDVGPDHPPSPSGFLRLLKGTRLRQLTVKLVHPLRWGSEIIVRRCDSLMVVIICENRGTQPHASAIRKQRM